jgi:hypothetical protein
MMKLFLKMADPQRRKHTAGRLSLIGISGLLISVRLSQTMNGIHGKA